MYFHRSREKQSQEDTFNEHKPITDTSPPEKCNRINLNWCHFFNDDGAMLLDTSRGSDPVNLH